MGIALIKSFLGTQPDLRSFQNVMGAKAPQDKEVLLPMKGDTIPLGNSAFPDIAGVLHFLKPQGRMSGVADEEGQLVIHHFLQVLRQGLIIPDETMGETKFHAFKVFKALRASSVS